MFDIEHLSSHSNFTYGMNSMTRGRSYEIIDFPTFLQENSDKIQKLQLLMTEGIKHGYVRPISRIVYSAFDVSRAFRLLSKSRQRGRVLIQFQEGSDKSSQLKLESRLFFKSDLSHLIVCDRSLFGLQVAKRLVHRGARKIYLHCLNQSKYIDFEIRSLKKLGAEIKVSIDPLKTKEDVSKLVNECIKLSPIEGVHITRFEDQPLSKTLDVLHELDLTTRKLCPHLEYFSVVSKTMNNGLQTCINRSRDNIPVSFLKLSIPSNQNDFDKASVHEFSALDLFERALKSKENFLIAKISLKESRSLIQEIFEEAGVQLPDDLKDTSTLIDLNFEIKKSQMICTYLRDTHNILVPEEDIPNLTVKRLKEIQGAVMDSAYEETKGLSTFFSYVDTDELLATTEIVRMPTRIESSLMRDDEFDVTQTYLCVIPGLEGHYERFRILCERLKVPAIVLQPSLEWSHETVTDLAQRYAKVILNKTVLRNKQEFYLVGYESGSLVALEMAAILEDNGLTGTLFIIGISPLKLQETIRRELENYSSDEELQIAIAIHMCNLMVGDSIQGLEEQLRKVKYWPERLKIAVNSILGKVSHSAQYARELILSAYERIKQVRDHKLIPRKLRSKLVMIKAASNFESSDNSFDGLQEFSQQPISFHQLRAPLPHSVQDLRCSAIINNHLSDDLLKTFEDKNLCDTYLLNADKFIVTDPLNMNKNKY